MSIAAPTASASGIYETGTTIHSLIGGLLSKFNDSEYLRDLLAKDPSGVAIA